MKSKKNNSLIKLDKTFFIGFTVGIAANLIAAYIYDKIEDRKKQNEKS